MSAHEGLRKGIIMTISNEAVEKARDAMKQLELREDPYGLLAWEAYAHTALEAAAPLIRADSGAKALEDAADEFENLPVNRGAEISSGTWDWFELFPIEHLRARAAALRGEG